MAIKKQQTTAPENPDGQHADLKAAADVTTDPEEKEQEASLIYCGPNMPKAFLSQFTVFHNGLPKMLDEHIEKCPSIKRLLVLVDQLSETLAAINQPGTAQSIWYQDVDSYVKGAAN